MAKQLIKDSYMPGDKVSMHPIPGRVPGEQGFEIKNISAMQRTANASMKKAKWLNSPAGLAVETVKGMPRTAAKMAMAPFKAVGRAVKGKIDEERTVHSYIGPESVFGAKHMEEQKKVLQGLYRKGDRAGMEAYAQDQAIRAGVKRDSKGNYSK